MALTRAPNNLPPFDRKDWDENSGMGGLLFVGEMGQMEVGVDNSYTRLYRQTERYRKSGGKYSPDSPSDR